MSEYHGDFDSWADVQEQFEPGWSYASEPVLKWSGGIGSRQRQVPPVEPEDVLWASYDNEGYGGYAVVIYRQGNRVFEVQGSHCSCYGLEGQWEPEEYDIPTYIAAAERGMNDYFAGKGRAVASAKLKLLLNG